MRKCIVSMNLSLDGFISGPQNDLDWHFESWNEEMGEKLLGILEKSDTILLGRITYEAMAKYWPFKPLDQDFPRQDLALADRMNNITKVVFSKTAGNGAWTNTKFTIRSIEEEVLDLKQRKGKDMLLFGSGRLASAFIRSGLVDEFLLWIHPIVLGSGKSFFPGSEFSLKLNLFHTDIFDSGVVVLSYRKVCE